MIAARLSATPPFNDGSSQPVSNCSATHPISAEHLCAQRGTSMRYAGRLQPLTRTPPFARVRVRRCAARACRGWMSHLVVCRDRARQGGGVVPWPPAWLRITAPGPSRFSSWVYSPPPPARKPVWPLQASPGCAPSPASWSRTSFGIWPQDWGGAPGPAGWSVKCAPPVPRRFVRHREEAGARPHG